TFCDRFQNVLSQNGLQSFGFHPKHICVWYGKQPFCDRSQNSLSQNTQQSSTEHITIFVTDSKTVCHRTHNVSHSVTDSIPNTYTFFQVIEHFPKLVFLRGLFSEE